jgi:hypothetical protein
MEASVKTETEAISASLLSLPGVSWAAIAAGATTIMAMTFLLLSLGVGLGMSVVSPWGGASVSPTTFKVGSGIYFLVIAMIASGLGGHLTGRLRRRYSGIHDNEVYFRDTANGFVAWALATIIGAAFLASAANGIVGSAVVASATNSSANNEPAAVYVDRLLRPATNGGTPVPTRDETQMRGDLSRLLTAALRDKRDLTVEDRAYVTDTVARQTGLSAPDAQKRVDEVLAQAKSDLDAARKVTLQLALWLTASLFLGAFAASIAAAEGGAIRDRNWGVRTIA